MTTILLNDNWRCTYTAPQADPPDFRTGEPIRSLTNWSVDPQQAGKTAWLKRTFELTTTDYCVNYVLRVAGAVAAQAYINGEEVGAVGAALDITMFVALGENEIVLRAEPGTALSFGTVELQPVPCE